MNLPPSPYKFPVYGLKLTKSEPIIDKDGSVLMGEENLPILLSGSDVEKNAKFFMANVKRNTTGHRWKIWLENSTFSLDA